MLQQGRAPLQPDDFGKSFEKERQLKTLQIEVTKTQRNRVLPEKKR